MCLHIFAVFNEILVSYQKRVAKCVEVNNGGEKRAKLYRIQYLPLSSHSLHPSPPDRPHFCMLHMHIERGSSTEGLIKLRGTLGKGLIFTSLSRLINLGSRTHLHDCEGIDIFGGKKGLLG